MGVPASRPRLVPASRAQIGLMHLGSRVLTVAVASWYASVVSLVPWVYMWQKCIVRPAE